MSCLPLNRQPHPLFPGILKLAGASVAIAIGLAAPAQAGPTDNNVRFLAALDKARIHYSSPGQAVAAGEAVCRLMEDGTTGAGVVSELMLSNPGLNHDGAEKFTDIAANVYCPQYLANTGGSGTR